MFKNIHLSKKLSKEEEVEKMLNAANAACKSISTQGVLNLGIESYIYSTHEAIEELGLDEELVQQLLEDYVSQIIKSVIQFREHITLLEDKKSSDYTPMRELAHKNLGVARNLRIKDAEKLLYELMKKDNLDYLKDCLMALELCAIKLKPTCAYETLQLIKIKQSI